MFFLPFFLLHLSSRSVTHSVGLSIKRLFAAPPKLLLSSHSRQTAKHSSKLMIMLVFRMGGKHYSAAFFLSLFVIFLFSLPFSLFAFSSSFYPVFGSSAEKEGEFEKETLSEWMCVEEAVTRRYTPHMHRHRDGVGTMAVLTKCSKNMESSRMRCQHSEWLGLFSLELCACVCVFICIHSH